MNNENKPIALVDLDQSIINYEDCLKRDLEKLRNPDEPSIWKYNEEPAYIRNRMNLIRASSDWWENLTPRSRGMQIVQAMIDLGFKIVICTQGPRKNAEAWKGKMLWVRKHLSEDVDIIITRDKGLIYGSVLMDDWPEYITRWIEHRPRGLVIMPAHDYNKDFCHPNVIRDDGLPESNFKINTALLNVLSKKGLINDK